MSLKDKLIKNTIYYISSQFFGFTLPLILTPIIISKIGTVEFGIYAILMGFVGAFGVLDLGVSASFIKYITEYRIKNEGEKLNKFISTGLLFYIIFSLIIIVISYFFAVNFLELFNISNDLLIVAVFSFKLSLVTFFFSNITTIFTCILFSTQNIQKTSVIGVFFHILNFVTVIYLLELNYGLVGLFYVQIGFSFSVFLLNYIVSRKSLPQVKISFRYFDIFTMKEMFRFGTQMQVSRIALLLSEKFDEFLLGAFTSLTNVTYFNSASKVVKASRFFPLQIIPQLGTVSAVLHTKAEEKKLKELFESFTKFLLIFSLPLLSFLFIYSDAIIFLWLGKGFETSAYILKILAVGQIAYIVFSIPGNAILPSIGMPKYIMHEGLITLIINVILTFTLVKYYGINGAAIGTTAAITLSSAYLFRKTLTAMKYRGFSTLRKIFGTPVLISIVLFLIFYFSDHFIINSLIPEQDWIISVAVVFITGCVYFILFSFAIHYSGYLSGDEKQLLRRIFSKIVPFVKPENPAN